MTTSSLKRADQDTTSGTSPSWMQGLWGYATSTRSGGTSSSTTSGVGVSLPSTSALSTVEAENLPEDSCTDLAESIRELVEELKERYQEILDDKHNLQNGHWDLSSPHPDGYGSVVGHQMQFEQKQRALQKLLDKFNSSGCGDGFEVTEDVWEWVTKPTPVPVPKPKPEGDEEIDWERVKDVVKALGLSIGLVAVILWAVLSPDPVGEMTAAGIGPGMVQQILQLLGLSPAVAG